MILFFLMIPIFVKSFHIKYNYDVPFVCEVHNVDLNHIRHSEIDDLKQLFVTTPVLIFKNQHITPSKQFEFCSQFDSNYSPRIIHPYLDTSIPESPQISFCGKGYISNMSLVSDRYVRNDQTSKYSSMWHQDLVGSRDVFPPTVSSMYITHPSNGYTSFASLEKGYENMFQCNPKWELLQACYRDSVQNVMDCSGYRNLHGYEQTDVRELKNLGKDIQVQALTVFPDKKYNKKALMLNPMHFYGFLGYSIRKSHEMMQKIMGNYVLRANNVAKVMYKKNNLVLFNNRKVIHSDIPSEEIVSDCIYSQLWLNTQDEVRVPKPFVF